MSPKPAPDPNQSDYQDRFERLSAEHTALLEQHEALLAEISDRQNRVAAYNHYKLGVADLDPGRIQFTPYLWHTLTDHADVNADGEIEFIFRDSKKAKERT